MKRFYMPCDVNKLNKPSVRSTCKQKTVREHGRVTGCADGGMNRSCYPRTWFDRCRKHTELQNKVSRSCYTVPVLVKTHTAFPWTVLTTMPARQKGHNINYRLLALCARTVFKNCWYIRMSFIYSFSYYSVTSSYPVIFLTHIFMTNRDI
jgi:hypothetical protein